MSRSDHRRKPAGGAKAVWPRCCWRLAAACLGAMPRRCPIRAAATMPSSRRFRKSKSPRSNCKPGAREVRVQGSLLGDEHAVIGAKVADESKQVHVDMGSPGRPRRAVGLARAGRVRSEGPAAQAELEQVRAKLGLKLGGADDKVDRPKCPQSSRPSARNQSRANLERRPIAGPERAMAAELVDSARPLRDCRGATDRP